MKNVNILDTDIAAINALSGVELTVMTPTY